MPISRLTPGSTYTFTTVSSSTDTISFINGSETPFNYVFRQGIVTGIDDFHVSSSNPIYAINNFASIENNAELFNRGTYRYELRSINSNLTSSYDVSFNNTDKSKLVAHGGLFVIDGSNPCTIILPHTATSLDGTCIKIIRNSHILTDTYIRTTSVVGDRFLNINQQKHTGAAAVSQIYPTIELISLGQSWICTSYTANWTGYTPT
jgi:hypothetical protein